MSDLKLDLTTDDLDVTDFTSPRMFTKGEAQLALAQRITIRLRTFLGEWFLDQNKGVPWVQQILGAKNAEGVALAVLRDVIQNTPGVLSVDEIEAALDSERLLTMSFKATTVEGVVDLSEVPLVPAPSVSDPWTPQQLVDAGQLAFWFDPSDDTTLTVTINGVEQMTDLSGNGRTAVPRDQSGVLDAGFAPTTAGGFLIFAASKSLVTDPSVIVDAASIFVVARFDGGATFSTGDVRPQGLISHFWSTSMTDGVILAGTDATALLSVPTDLETAPLGINGAIPPAALLGLAAIPVLPTLSSVALLSFYPQAEEPFELEGFAIGASPELAVDGWVGGVGEIIAPSVEISDGVARRIEGYLAHKWGTSTLLPYAHPYRFAAPTIDD